VSTHASALAIGHRLQEYIIGRLLGHGGFGLTYLAQDTNLNSLVAIKEFLPQEFAIRNADNSVVPKSEFDADSYTWGLERFKEEARALARFKHPNIVRVSRLLEANGTAYMVMDFEPGLTLSQYLKRHGPTLEEGKLLGLFLPVLDGLEALHRLQLVHRDIKPSNIYVRAYGGPMLIDFGAVRQAIGAQSRNLTSLVTPGSVRRRRTRRAAAPPSAMAPKIPSPPPSRAARNSIPANCWNVWIGPCSSGCATVPRTPTRCASACAPRRCRRRSSRCRRAWRRCRNCSTV
jgi:serine/threonine protein kinase